MTKSVSPEARARYDQIFMQVVQSVQVEAQSTQPQQGGTLAAMFHKEQVAGALQGCATLIADWNAGRLEESTLKKTAGALRGLGLPESATRVENLVNIEAE